MAWPGRCNQCGACCRVLTVPQSIEEIMAMAALTSALGIPSDSAFAARHWRPLTVAEALRRNAFYARQLPVDAHLYACDQLGADGRCRVHDQRPLVCRGYPWYERPPRAMPLPDPACGYAVDQRAAGVRRGGTPSPAVPVA